MKVAENKFTAIENDRHFTDDVFKHILLNENTENFNSNFTEICSQGSSLQNKKAVVRVIFCANGGLAYRRIYASLGLN